ncbi:MAG: bifunctional glutamine synthetase adenylyltransferase/deadenyltransferase, partial [Sedimenticola sp.]|nr:bifunctional glutamine synthetase adenylyltransferase/deadenyltransferase [Sedimenticola sp.]
MLPLLQPQEEANKRWCDWRSGSPVIAESLCSAKGFEQELLKVWEGSDFVVQCCVREPELLVRLQQSGQLSESYAEGDIASQLASILAEVTDEVGLQHHLRRFRNEQMVRIIWRDLSQRAPLAETLADLSGLADACVDQA